MNILLLGGGGREHALAWKIAQSPLLEKLYVSPGNGGMGDIAELVALDVKDHQAVISFCKDKDIGLVVIGPEDPLVDGLSDSLDAAGIKAFGPKAQAALLEGSKNFTKEICMKYDIPTAAYQSFEDLAAAKAYLDIQGAPIVIKADGLAAGKGVTVAATLDEAHAALADCLDGSPGARVVIEDYLQGEEASFFALCDGRHALALATAQDHKRVGEGDTGPNTGGMGAYSPAPVMDDALCAEVMDKIIQPTLTAMQDLGCPFQGVLYAGLMITAQGPKLIEYNVRFGDPECQVLMTRMKSDIVALMLACTTGELAGQSVEWDEDVAMVVVMANKGYPALYPKGDEIHGIQNANALDKSIVFHAGTQNDGGKTLATGGRVLGVTAKGSSVEEAAKRAYEAVDAISWPHAYVRRDIGWRAIQRESQ